ncbi:unnamed protein product [Didymodactylos carnosus]|uniref:Uncharacterized protein n=1 Tax=Didymodactylos carnosus TaxID=1234261 RepID=A0A814V0B7_9BILA|nr:unnamed protein product [Didymodactylos carnosus]CAF1181655.1 unnamed protein product [Didymodactylos carnosus]CAF3774850.1 unnamed protein product [Didymodactylos carnosus]CAF3945995.1 unnamed protein product [Didymodactylos carnosus]
MNIYVNPFDNDELFILNQKGYGGWLKWDMRNSNGTITGWKRNGHRSSGGFQLDCNRNIFIAEGSDYVEFFRSPLETGINSVDLTAKGNDKLVSLALDPTTGDLYVLGKYLKQIQEYILMDQVKIKTSINSNSLSSICPIPLNATWKNSGVIHFSNNNKSSLSLNNPLDLFLDNKNNYIYIVDTNNSRIQRFAPKNNQSIETVAKLGLYLPQSIWIDSNTGDMYIIDITIFTVNHQQHYKYYRVQYWQKNAATGKIIINGTDSVLINKVLRIELDADLNIYISYNLFVRKWFAPDYTYRIIVAGQWKNSVDNSIGPIGMYIDNKTFDLYLFVVAYTYKGRLEKWTYGSQNATVLLSNLPGARTMTFDCNMNIYFATTDQQGLYQFNPLTQNLNFITAARNNLDNPSAIKFDRDGNLYVLERKQNQLKKFSIILHE